MKLLVDRLGPTPDSYRFEVPASWWHQREANAASGCEVVESLVFGLQAQKVGTQIVLAGELQTAISAECSRCTARYRHALRETYRLVLDPAGERIPADPESADALREDGLCLEEEIEAGWYRGPELDLDAFFSEVVALALPLQPLCREDCAGLCPQCGADRNLGACGCVERQPESPFAVLAQLKETLN